MGARHGHRHVWAVRLPGCASQDRPRSLHRALRRPRLPGELVEPEAPDDVAPTGMKGRPPSWRPDWKRAPCLGCGRRVVRVRDGWVEIGGNRSGSYLIAWGEEPLLSYVTDPEHSPDEPLFLLGVSHQRCLSRVRARLL